MNRPLFGGSASGCPRGCAWVATLIAITGMMAEAIAAPPRASDTVLLNGEILLFHGVERRAGGDGGAGGGTGAGGARGERREGSGEGRPQFAPAAAISGGRFVWIGPTDQAKRRIGPGTKVIDLGGRMVMPGIIDGHFHGTRITDCHLGYEGGTIPQVLAKLQACLDRPDQAALKKTGTRMQANYLFGEALEPPGTTLTRHDLDRLDTTRPIMVNNADGHKFWMNSRAIANAHIDETTPDPFGGFIGRDADRKPNGAFADFEVENWGPAAPVTEEMLFDRVRRTNADANRAGITSVFIPGDGESEIAQWAKLQEEGKLTLRTNVGLSASFVHDHPDPAGLQKLIGDLSGFKKYARGMIEVTSVKVYCDGVMEFPAQTAAMIAPYRVNTGTAAAPDWRPGKSRGPDPSCSDARAGFVALDKAGWQIHVHAIGDRATRDALDNYQAAMEQNGARDLRHTITHLEAIDAADIPRFQKLGVIASMSLQWARRDAYTVGGTRGYIEETLYDRLFPAAEILRTGGIVAGGSDYPVDPLRPFVQIETTMTHTGEAIPGVLPGALAPREAIPDLLAAIKLHTINAAYQMHHERDAGSIEVGKVADLIVLSQNLFKVPTDKISDTRVLLTMVDGRIAYDAGELRAGVDRP